MQYWQRASIEFSYYITRKGRSWAAPIFIPERHRAFVGSRYHRVHALAEFAVKCGITYDEFKKDAYELYKIFSELDKDEPFHYQEFVKARDEYFSTISHKSTRDWIERSTGIHMNPPAKRNGRSRHDHITRVNLKRKMEHETFGDAYAGGRPPKQAQVEEWQAAHPGGKKIDCHRDTGLSRSTIDKWWQ